MGIKMYLKNTMLHQPRNLESLTSVPRHHNQHQLLPEHFLNRVSQLLKLQKQIVPLY